MAGPNIKWTAGPGPAPLPYSKRAREAMGVTDDVRNVIDPLKAVLSDMAYSSTALVDEVR